MAKDKKPKEKLTVFCIQMLCVEMDTRKVVGTITSCVEEASGWAAINTVLEEALSKGLIPAKILHGELDPPCSRRLSKACFCRTEGAPCDYLRRLAQQTSKVPLEVLAEGLLSEDKPSKPEEEEG